MCPKRDLFDAASDDAAAGGCFVLRDVRLFDLADAAGGAVDSEDDVGGGAVDSEDAAGGGCLPRVVRLLDADGGSKAVPRGGFLLRVVRLLDADGESEDAAVAGVWLLVVRVFAVFAMLSGVISGED